MIHIYMHIYMCQYRKPVIRIFTNGSWKFNTRSSYTNVLLFNIYVLELWDYTVVYNKDLLKKERKQDYTYVDCNQLDDPLPFTYFECGIILVYMI